MPNSYAIPEILIVLIALWAGQKCWRAGYIFAAIGILLLGSAAAIGIVRILSAPNEALTMAHKTVSGLGGLTSMGLIALELIKSNWPEDQKSKRSFYALFGVLMSLAAAIVTPALTAPLLLIWAGCAVIAAYVLPAPNNKVRALRAGSLSLIVLNFIIIRQNPILGPDLSWHIYHMVVALWIWLVTRILIRD
jgi:hypothetical protein